MTENITYIIKDTKYHKITIVKDEVRVKVSKNLKHELELLKKNVTKILDEVKYTNRTLRGSICFDYDNVCLRSECRKYYYNVKLIK